MKKRILIAQRYKRACARIYVYIQTLLHQKVCVYTYTYIYIIVGSEGFQEHFGTASEF